MTNKFEDLCYMEPTSWNGKKTFGETVDGLDVLLTGISDDDQLELITSYLAAKMKLFSRDAVIAMTFDISRSITKKHDMAKKLFDTLASHSTTAI